MAQNTLVSSFSKVAVLSISNLKIIFSKAHSFLIKYQNSKYWMCQLFDFFSNRFFVMKNLLICTVQNGIWQIFYEFLIFHNLFQDHLGAWLKQSVEYEKQVKYLSTLLKADVWQYARKAICTRSGERRMENGDGVWWKENGERGMGNENGEWEWKYCFGWKSLSKQYLNKCMTSLSKCPFT